MKPRLSYMQISPEPLNAMVGLNQKLANSGIEPMLAHLVRMRASQINGCAYCIDMHSKDLRALGETEMRIYGLDAWRETPFYSDRERAALEWTEAVTKISQTHAEDEIYERVKTHFTDKELVDLTWIIVEINAWNRLAISFRAVPGKYKSTLGAEKHG